ncbi:hypothetical protein HMPREF0476_1361 [Kingella kingae ATCC 23330]|uniref:Uncharacterized protein n=1 Tax=Kingella kingae ATCC 23330 TaxID=887327 RepID=F5S828_KINKI|nr:hypothetical protein HMPREF0476_1361 [Kingella kingae ATCC 23330]
MKFIGFVCVFYSLIPAAACSSSLHFLSESLICGYSELNLD